jgi:AcrR family transcriptional regulator
MVNLPGHDAMPTENRILEAAKIVFFIRGFDGTSMQDIADEAGINKSLLHYYFRSKEKLFSAVFNYAFQQFIPQMHGILNSGESIFIKIEKIVSEYMDLLRKNQFIPAFILHEINMNPDRLYNLMQDSGLKPMVFIGQFAEEISKGTIKPMDPRQLIVNILAVCIFPVAARPLLQRILFENNDAAYEKFLDERKKVVAEFIIQSIKA